MSVDKNLLQLHKGVKAYGPQVLFNEASFSINEGEHVGVIGPNGAGKSTLFKVLIDEESLDQGLVVRSRELKIGYLSQHDLWRPDETGNSYLERTSLLPLWEVKSLGRELQVSEEVFDRPIQSLSGGYRMRIKLMGLLGQSPNLMLLDEPTNYLDLETTLILEQFLQGYKGAFLLISHDREFLRRTTDHTLEIEAGEMVKFNGNIDDYFEQKEMLREQLQARAASLEEKRKTILDFVSRFGAKATKAKQAQSRLKSLSKMEKIDLKPLPNIASIRIPPPDHVGKAVIRLEQARFGYGENTVLQEVSLQILRGDHVAVIGLNGAGKSTLLKGLAGTLEPLKGLRELGYQVRIAIYNQHVIEVLNEKHTILQSLEDVAHPDVTLQEIKDMAGSLLFSGDHIRKKIKVLSGGEKSRVALGRILLQKVPFLLLDEPTNHLDFQTVEGLIQALSNYAGTVIVVSHDRSFVRRVGTKILEVSKGEVHLYSGSYEDYVWSLQQRLKDEDVVEEKDITKKPQAIPQRWVGKKEIEQRLRKVEKELKLSETKLEKLGVTSEGLNEKISTSVSPAKCDIDALAANALEIEKIEENWLKLESERDALTFELLKIKGEK